MAPIISALKGGDDETLPAGEQLEIVADMPMTPNRKVIKT
jgi:hypothetical protein